MRPEPLPPGPLADGAPAGAPLAAGAPAAPPPDRDARLRRLAWAEGTSLLVLMGVAVPLKYAAGLPMATRVAGLVHGLLFLAYVVAVLDALGTRRLNGRGAAIAIAAATLPGGTFVLARRLGRARG